MYMEKHGSALSARELQGAIDLSLAGYCPGSLAPVELECADFPGSTQKEHLNVLRYAVDQTEQECGLRFGEDTENPPEQIRRPNILASVDFIERVDHTPSQRISTVSLTGLE